MLPLQPASSACINRSSITDAVNSSNSSHPLTAKTNSPLKMPVSNAIGPNQKRAGDINYLRTDEGWQYLAVVIDLWSRAVIGWSMSSRMTPQLACDALQMALWQRKRPDDVIVHTDRGGQYCSADYQALLQRHNLRGSVSAKGCCYDNACVESFFHSLKVECIHGERFISREIMRTTVFNYIECDYNRWRRHSACVGLSMEQLENQNLA
ncbi:transposase insF for insertion sequence IS3fB [Enterobacter cloacae BWH 43]|nr:transposase insF for insertion sequence IS3fB [Enterobacter cloacae BWH 43]